MGTTGTAEQWKDVRVSLGADAEISGKLSFVSPTRIEGKLKGELRSSDLVVVGPEAHVQATVRAARLVVMGEVQGEVLGATRVEICPGGRLIGDIESTTLVIHEGGFFEGSSKRGQPAAPVAQQS
jgi:cytoskeletal protein CcmA (bactofilin family)